MPNFDSKNEGTWFYFVPDDESQGGVCLRELSSDESIRIERITDKKKRKPQRGQLVETVVRDEKMYSRLLWDFCIVNWKNVQLDGIQIECNTENKAKIVNVIDFAKFVGEAITELVDSNKTIDEARVKNSESSSDGN